MKTAHTFLILFLITACSKAIAQTPEISFSNPVAHCQDIGQSHWFGEDQNYVYYFSRPIGKGPEKFLDVKCGFYQYNKNSNTLIFIPFSRYDKNEIPTSLLFMNGKLILTSFKPVKKNNSKASGQLYASFLNPSDSFKVSLKKDLGFYSSFPAHMAKNDTLIVSYRSSYKYFNSEMEAIEGRQFEMPNVFRKYVRLSEQNILNIRMRYINTYEYPYLVNFILSKSEEDVISEIVQQSDSLISNLEASQKADSFKSIHFRRINLDNSYISHNERLSVPENKELIDFRAWQGKDSGIYLLTMTSDKSALSYTSELSLYYASNNSEWPKASSGETSQINGKSGKLKLMKSFDLAGRISSLNVSISETDSFITLIYESANMHMLNTLHKRSGKSVTKTIEKTESDTAKNQFTTHLSHPYVFQNCQILFKEKWLNGSNALTGRYYAKTILYLDNTTGKWKEIPLSDEFTSFRSFRSPYVCTNGEGEEMLIFFINLSNNPKEISMCKIVLKK